ncbi:hypothetical protein IH781_02890 [Patescibacteria group bacterium]|nr:hypothetical protein [Patescibacteria group bacterium]
MTKLRASYLVLPVLLLGGLQIPGCNREAVTVTPPPPPGGVYLSDSAGALYDQSVQRDDEPGKNISFPMWRAHQPVHRPQTIYLAAGNRDITVSHNFGQSWEIIDTPLATISSIIELTNGVLVASGRDVNRQGFIIRSGDDGKSWEEVLTVPQPIQPKKRRLDIIKVPGSNQTSDLGVPLVTVTLVADPLDGNRVYAGTNLGNILVSDQSAKTWTTIRTLEKSDTAIGIREIIPSPHRSGELIIRKSDYQLLRVTNEGVKPVTVKAAEVLLQGEAEPGKASGIWQVRYIDQFPKTLLVSLRNGAAISRDGGLSWTRLPLPVDVGRRFNFISVAVSPVNPDRMFVAVNDVIYRSEDGGKSWHTLALEIGTNVVIDILFDPDNPAKMLLITTTIPIANVL